MQQPGVMEVYSVKRFSKVSAAVGIKEVSVKEGKKNNFKTYVALVKYGISVKVNVAAMILFVLLGIVGEITMVFVDSMGYVGFMTSVLDFGALLLFCAAMYPGQLLLSTNLSSMVQASACKKKLQTTAPALLCLVCNLAAMAIILLIRGVGAWMMPHRAPEIMGGLVAAGFLVLGIDILAAMLYKFFYLSIAVYFVLCLAFGMFSSYRIVMGVVSNYMGRLDVSAPAAIAFCLGMVFVGAAVQYLLNTAIYKYPISKAAFGSSTVKKLV